MKHSFWGVLGRLGLAAALVGHPAGAAGAELKVGDKAPPFALIGTDGRTYSLDQFKGQKAVVLAWFPGRTPPVVPRSVSQSGITARR